MLVQLICGPSCTVVSTSDKKTRKNSGWTSYLWLCCGVQALTDVAPRYMLQVLTEAEVLVNITEHKVS